MIHEVYSKSKGRIGYVKKHGKWWGPVLTGVMVLARRKSRKTAVAAVLRADERK